MPDQTSVSLYQVKRSRSTGAVFVKYSCPHCQQDLKNPISQAGQEDQCPACGAGLAVPGKEALAEIEAKKQSERAAQERERHERESKKIEQTYHEAVERGKDSPPPKTHISDFDRHPVKTIAWGIVLGWVYLLVVHIGLVLALLLILIITGRINSLLDSFIN
jgi:Zn-finger nucleic acid-binding protein